MNKLFLFFITLLIIINSLLISYELTIYTTKLTQAQQQTFNYILKDNPLPQDYNKNEASHLEDVKKVMSKVSIALFFSLTSMVIILLHVKYKMKVNILELLSKATKIAIIFSIIFALLAITIFPTLFTYFHYLFFPQGNWIFPENSRIITTFPESFFQSIAIQIGITTILLQLIFPITNVLIKRYKKK